MYSKSEDVCDDNPKKYHVHYCYQGQQTCIIEN
jgi:hypothetical protein